MSYSISISGSANNEDVQAIFEDLIRALRVVATDNVVVSGTLSLSTGPIKASDVADEDILGPEADPIP